MSKATKDMRTRVDETKTILVNMGATTVADVRNLTDATDGVLLGTHYLIMDRDPVFTKEIRAILKTANIKSVVLPPKSPNLNAYAERFMRSIKEACLNKIIFFGEQSLRWALTDFLTHYHQERNHQGLDNRLMLTPGLVTSPAESNAESGLAAC